MKRAVELDHAGSGTPETSEADLASFVQRLGIYLRTWRITSFLVGEYGGIITGVPRMRQPLGSPMHSLLTSQETQIVEEYLFYDLVTFMRQIGLMG